MDTDICHEDCKRICENSRHSNECYIVCTALCEKPVVEGDVVEL